MINSGKVKINPKYMVIIITTILIINASGKRKYDDIKIIGHRGAHSVKVDNSISGFIYAKNAGADGIEFDVRFTKDKKNIVMHSGNLRHTTVCRGPVHKKTLSGLKKCKLKNGEKIRTLPEVLKIIKDWYQLSFLEIKTSDEWAVEQSRDVADTLLKYNLQDKFVITSYNRKSLLYLRTRFKDGIIAGWDDFSPASLDNAIKFGHKYALMPRQHANRKIVERAMRHDKIIVVYTVNTIKQLKREYRKGIRIIITDKNRYLIDYIKQEK